MKFLVKTMKKANDHQHTRCIVYNLFLWRIIRKIPTDMLEWKYQINSSGQLLRKSEFTFMISPYAGIYPHLSIDIKQMKLLSSPFDTKTHTTLYIGRTHRFFASLMPPRQVVQSFTCGSLYFQNKKLSCRYTAELTYVQST